MSTLNRTSRKLVLTIRVELHCSVEIINSSPPRAFYRRLRSSWLTLTQSANDRGSRTKFSILDNRDLRYSYVATISLNVALESFLMVFQVLPPEATSTKWRLSARFGDTAGNLVCWINKNELSVGIDNFDVIQTAERLSITVNDGTAMLELQALPPEGLILSKYTCISERGKITIAEVPFVDPFGPERVETTLTFTTATSGMSFSRSQFISYRGIDLRFREGSLQFG